MARRCHVQRGLGRPVRLPGGSPGEQATTTGKIAQREFRRTHRSARRIRLSDSPPHRRIRQSESPPRRQIKPSVSPRRRRIRPSDSPRTGESGRATVRHARQADTGPGQSGERQASAPTAQTTLSGSNLSEAVLAPVRATAGKPHLSEAMLAAVRVTAGKPHLSAAVLPPLRVTAGKPHLSEAGRTLAGVTSLEVLQGQRDPGEAAACRRAAGGGGGRRR